MTSFKILPYSSHSLSAKKLAALLEIKRLKKVNSSFKAKNSDVVINWGASHPPDWEETPVYFNNPERVAIAVDKLKFFTLLKETVPDIIPKFWTNKEDIPPEAFPVLARQSLTGHSGAGICWCNDADDCVDAPLYTKYVKKKDEYRVHVGMIGPGATMTISIQRKAMRSGAEVVNWQIRNHANGFVYVRGGVNPPFKVVDAAHSALIASGLDFGAVDVVWNEVQQKAYVLEINTAPGLEGLTVNEYASYFKEVLQPYGYEYS